MSSNVIEFPAVSEIDKNWQALKLTHAMVSEPQWASIQATLMRQLQDRTRREEGQHAFYLDTSDLMLDDSTLLPGYMAFLMTQFAGWVYFLSPPSLAFFIVQIAKDFEQCAAESGLNTDRDSMAANRLVSPQSRMEWLKSALDLVFFNHQLFCLEHDLLYVEEQKSLIWELASYSLSEDEWLSRDERSSFNPLDTLS